MFFADAVTRDDGSIFQYSGSSNLVLNNRQIEIASPNGTPTFGHQIRRSGTGTLTINTDLLVTSTTAQTLRLGGSNATGTNTFAGRIGNGSSPAVSLAKFDGSTWALTGTNSYSGATTIEAGTLEIGGSGVLGGGSYAGNISIASSNSGRLFVNSSAAQTISGAITGAGALVKDNTGTLTLTNANGYSGVTTVNGGTLLVDGSLGASSVVTVASGATLGGNGTIGGAATVNGTLAPGSSPGILGPGILGFGSSLVLGSTASTSLEINGTSRGTQYDGVDAGTALTYGGGLTMNFGAAFEAGNYSLDLFTSGTRSGNLTSVALAGSYAGALVSLGGGIWQREDGGNTWTFTQSTGQLTMAIVPEPGTFLILASGLALFSLHACRRRVAPARA